MSENTETPVETPKPTPEPRKAFRLLKSETNGKTYFHVLTKRGNIGAHSEHYERHQGSLRGIKSIAKSVYLALQSIDFDLSRIEEIIDDETLNSTEPITQISNDN